ncbi:MAG: adenylyltransferase/cytidyltransferase family protein [Bacteroidaceae bacterium]|nr:adenylyltransferase/cytidyltransferase family protein [Bacteroidaceae bacterium]
MKKVITYGTYDLLHFGHIRLLERAKALGDYLIVGVTSDDFDISRGKINVQQSLMERIEAVRATGLADKIVIEQYEGQKIDDIQKYGVDIFTVGSDWVGVFDYLKEYCEVVYLDRTQGVSSTEIRSKENALRLGLVGDTDVINKFALECKNVNGINVIGYLTMDPMLGKEGLENAPAYTSFQDLVHDSDALFIRSHPTKHYEQIKYALQQKKHVLYESPLTLNHAQAKELFEMADKNGCVLYAGIKTAYSTAYARMILMVKTGKIGDVVSVDAVCTSLQDDLTKKEMQYTWNSITAWGPTAMLPVFQLLGTDCLEKRIVSRLLPGNDDFDTFTKIDWTFPHAVASIKVGKGVKAEGELIIGGTKGYIYVPAPWWKTDYFEVRTENQSQNKRFFYQLEGEGIRGMIASFVKSVNQNKLAYIGEKISLEIVKTMEEWHSGKFTQI